MTAKELAHCLKSRFGNLISESVQFRAEVTVHLADPESIAEVCQFAKQSLGFDFLVDITSVDNYGTEPRWRVVYEWYSLGQRAYLRLTTGVTEAKSELPSVTSVWRGADWHEREIFDLMGLRFRGHPDLRRILMWEGYPHHPLRKDFPLAGRVTELPDGPFTQPAPLEGGPFVTLPGGPDSGHREPRARGPES
jgi:NADH-quinone oxidoreductase subunit C